MNKAMKAILTITVMVEMDTDEDESKEELLERSKNPSEWDDWHWLETQSVMYQDR